MIPSDLRAELPYLLLAAIVLVAGAAMATFSALRIKDRALLYFGVFAGLYGARLLVINRIFLKAFDIPPPLSEWCEAAITYTITIPGALFFRMLISPEWRHTLLGSSASLSSLRRLRSGMGSHYRASLGSQPVNSAIVIACMLIAASLVIYRYRRGHVWLLLSFLLLLVTVVMANLQIDIGGYDPEPVGFLVFLLALGSLAAGRAFERERRLKSVEQELELARRIQHSILPARLPTMQGLVMTARYEPMKEVAGDFYDFIAFDERRCTLLVADVSGHGVPAALIASMLKVAFGAQKEYATDPAEVLSRMNAALHGILDRQFVTAACAHIDLPEGTLRYAGAGHPPGLLWKSDSGELVELAENGLFLGPFQSATYKNVSHPVDPGDLFLLYTDGLVEGTSSDGQPFGAERLRHFVRANSGQDPAMFVDDLLDRPWWVSVRTTSHCCWPRWRRPIPDGLRPHAQTLHASDFATNALPMVNFENQGGQG